MRITEVRDRLAYWQGRLNIPEWKITVKYAALKDMDGCAEWWTERLEARITLSRRQPTHQIEHTLVHELLHVVLYGHAPYEQYNKDRERAINRIASALITNS